jgi:hypothetical protein
MSTGDRNCRRCGQTVESDQFDVFERMHYVCFHFEFEHTGDVDQECGAGGCPSKQASLAESLRTWTDWDVSSFHLGRAIGLFERQEDWQRTKGVFWTDNRIGNGLRSALLALVEAGVLERREEPDEQFRWSADGR